jgi:DsbC/DsbD-like thiol-disulfide interchange protein
MKTCIGFLLALLALPCAALAAATDWIEEDGARIRLVAAEPAPDAADIRAALVVELKPGWKTYWRDPGDAGVPPLFTLSGGGNIHFSTMEYPAPERFEEGAAKSIGYKQPVAFPLTLALQSPGRPSVIKATAFLGICEEICIPVQLEFALDVPVAVGSTADQGLVQAAFDALPKPADASFGLAELAYQPKALEIEVAAPPSATPPELFLAADRFLFGAPKLISALKDRSRFSVPIVFAPKTARIEDTEVHYTIRSGGMAVSGLVPPRAN